MFYSRVHRPITVSSPVGDRLRERFVEVINNGQRFLEVVGYEDTYALIQEAAPACDINAIVDRYASGDLNAVAAMNKVQGVFADVTTAPSTLMEAQNSIIKARRIFDSLSAAKRQQFDNSFDKFIEVASIDPQTFKSIFLSESDSEGVSAGAVNKTESAVAPIGADGNEINKE